MPRGLAELRRFDPLAARNLLQNAVAADPKSVLAHSALSAAWTELGYDANAAREGKTAFELSRGLSRRDSMAIEAEYRDSNGERDKAVDLYKSLWTFFPDVEYGLRLADAQTSAGAGQAALATIASLRNVASPARGDPRIDLTEARAADSLSDYKRARSAALRASDKANALRSKFLAAQAELQVTMGDLLLAQGDLTGAEKNYDGSLRLRTELGERGGIASCKNSLAAVSLEKGLFAQSESLAREAAQEFRTEKDADQEISAHDRVARH